MADNSHSIGRCASKKIPPPSSFGESFQLKHNASNTSASAMTNEKKAIVINNFNVFLNGGEINY
jgi:hypothetical protein